MRLSAFAALEDQHAWFRGRAFDSCSVLVRKLPLWHRTRRFNELGPPSLDHLHAWHKRRKLLGSSRTHWEHTLTPCLLMSHPNIDKDFEAGAQGTTALMAFHSDLKRPLKSGPVTAWLSQQNSRGVPAFNHCYMILHHAVLVNDRRHNARGESSVRIQGPSTSYSERKSYDLLHDLIVTCCLREESLAFLWLSSCSPSCHSAVATRLATFVGSYSTVSRTGLLVAENLQSLMSSQSLIVIYCWW